MKPKKAYARRKKRLGRGPGSGKGKTAGRGHKGQLSRSGSSAKPGFEGGQNPLYRRLPKRGFSHAAFRPEYRIVNLELIGKLGEKQVTPDTLIAKGFIKNVRDGLRVLAKGELKEAVEIQAHYFSRAAKEKIEKAGGKAVLIGAQKA